MAFTKSLIAAVAAMAMSASLVSAVPVHHDLAIRKAAPADWWSGWEYYQVFHRRYNALGCKYQHDTIFFRDCCGPLYKGTTLAVRPDMCDPKKHPYTATATKTPAPAKTGSAGDEDEDDDDQEYKAWSKKNNEEEKKEKEDKKEEEKKEDKKEEEEEKPATDDSNDDDSNDGGSGGEVNKGGYATFYDQNGNAGACGKVNPDSAMIGAIDHERWGKDSFGEVSDLCGKQVRITNTKNNKSVTITIADVCPTCENGNSIDLSRGAFNKIATESEGMVPITWQFV